MAVTWLGEVGSANNKTSGTTLAVTNTSASVIPAGTLLLMVVGYDNHASLTAATVTASNTGGATWTQRLGPIGSGVTTTAGAGIWDTTFSCRTVSDIATGGTLTTLTFSNAVVAKLAVIVGLRGVLETLRGTSTSGTSTSGVPSVTTGGTAPVAGDIVIGTASFESNSATGDSDTLNGSWSAQVTEITTGGGAAATNIAQTVQYKIVTAGGHQTYNPTGANDSIASVRAFLPEPDPTVTQAAYRLYADGTESGSTALAAQDTAYTADVSGGDVNLQVRVREQSTNATALAASDDWQLQWEKNASGTWREVATGGEGLADSYDSANQSATETFAVVGDAVGQSFLGNGRKLSRARFWMRRVGAPTGTIRAYLNAHTGVFGDTGTGTSSMLGFSSTILDVSTVDTSFAWYSFDFPGTLTLVAGTPYVINVSQQSGTTDGSNRIDVGVDNTSPTHAGSRSLRATGGTWVALSTVDAVFEVYTTFVESTAVPYASANLLADSYPSSNRNSNIQLATIAYTSVCQSFLGDGRRLTRAGFFLDRFGGTPNGTVTAVLYAHTGTFGSTGTGTGAPLATSTTVLDPLTLTSTYTWTYFDFDGTVTLASGTPYCLGVTTTNTVSPSIEVGIDTTSPTHAGNASRLAAPSTWTVPTADVIFEVYTDADGASTTNRLTGGTGTFTAGKISETGLVTDLGWPGNNYTELLYSVTLKAADVADTDVIRFRVLRNGATTGLTYTATPTLTASMGAGGSFSKGSTPLAVTATIAAAGVVDRSSGATLTVTSTITSAGTVPVSGFSGTAALPLTATLTAAGLVGTSRGSTVLAVTDTITAAGVVARTTGATLAVTDVVTAAGLVAATSTATVATTATVTAAGSVVAGSSGTATLAVSSTITAAGSVATSSTAALGVTDTITAAGAMAASAGATLTVTDTITAAGVVARSADASLPVTATVTAAGTVARSTTAVPLAVTATVTPVGTMAASLGATRPVTATITTNGQVVAASGATLAATATVTAAGVLNTANTAALPVTATVTAAGAVIVAGGGNATFPVTATITAAGVVTRTGAATLPTTAAITAGGAVARASSATRPTTAAIAAAGVKGTVAGAALTVTDTTTAAGLVATSTGAALVVTSTVTASGVVGTAQFAGAGLTVTATVATAGIVATSRGATPLVVTSTVTAAGGTSGAAALAAAAAISAAGQVAAGTGSALAVTATITAAGGLDVTGTTELTVTALLTATGGVITADDGSAVRHPLLTVHIASSGLTAHIPTSSLEAAVPVGGLEVTQPTSDLAVTLPIRELELLT